MSSEPSHPLVQKFVKVDDKFEGQMADVANDCLLGRGDASDCNQAAEFYSIIKEDHTRAARIYERNCQDNNFAESCFFIGKFFYFGKGVSQSNEKAITLFDKACKGGSAPGCYYYAVMQWHKTRTENPTSSQSKKLASDAFKLLQDCCVKGISPSCHFVGNELLRTDNPMREPRKAIDYLERSCDKDYGPSCFNLAVLYRKGDVGVETNETLFEKYKLRAKETLKTESSK